MSHDPADCMLSSIDNFIICLEGIKSSMDSIFARLENATQEEIDRVIVEEVNPTINKKLADMRSMLIKSLQSTYESATKLIDKLTPINDTSPTNLATVIQLVQSIKDFILGAYAIIMEFMTILPQHLIRLNDAIASLVAYSPPISGFDFSKLNIKMESITMEDITG